MEPRERTIRIYSTADGRLPFEEWITNLKDRQARAIIRVRLERVEDGNLGNCKSLGDGVNELKISFGPGYRIYFGEDGPIVVLLLCGGDKGSQSKDVREAKKFWADYQKRG